MRELLPPASEARDVSDCAACHAVQADLLAGRIAGIEGKPDPMAELECTDCHGQPPELLRSSPALCVLCHEPGYDEMRGTWRSTMDGLRAEIERAISADPSTDAAARARELLRALEADGSRGAHNFALAQELAGTFVHELDGR